MSDLILFPLGQFRAIWPGTLQIKHFPAAVRDAFALSDIREKRGLFLGVNGLPEDDPVITAGGLGGGDFLGIGLGELPPF